MEESCCACYLASYILHLFIAYNSFMLLDSMGDVCFDVNWVNNHVDRILMKEVKATMGRGTQAH